MAYKRTDRVNALLQRELGTLISEELRDPRITFPTVTQVVVSPDLRVHRTEVPRSRELRRASDHLPLVVDLELA